MSLLSQAKKGVIPGPKINLIYGPNKVGKTTFVTSFPQHVLLDLEKGSNAVYSANRVQGFESLAHVQDTVNDLLNTPHDYKVLGVDSVEALEGLIFDHLCAESKVTSIEDVGGGFGKGFVKSREIMRQLMGQFRQLCDKRGVEVFLIGHSQTKDQNDPITNSTYTKYLLRTNDKMASIIKDLADNIIFVSRRMLPAKKDAKEIVVSDNKTYAYTQWRVGFDAGNRINLPFEFELSYDNWMLAKEAGRPVTLDELKAETFELLKGLDGETRPKAEQTLKKATTIEEVAAIKQRALTLVTT